MKNRNARKASHRLGIKRFSNNDETELATFYMSPCCEDDTIRKVFSFGTFSSKRSSYVNIANEAEKSQFIDRLLESSVRVDAEHLAYFEFYIDGKCLKKNLFVSFVWF